MAIKAAEQQLINQRQAEYKAGQKRRRQRFIVWSGLTVLFTTIFSMMLAGQAFAPVLNILGLKSLYVEEGGIYTDCSKPENRDVPFCQPKSGRAEQTWRSIGRNGSGAPFSLSE